jgi:hypothetical protein
VGGGAGRAGVGGQGGAGGGGLGARRTDRWGGSASAGTPTYNAEGTLILDPLDFVDPTPALIDNRMYVVGDDDVLYGLEYNAPDNVPPSISEAVVEIEGEQQMRFAYAVPTDDVDDFPLRFSDVVTIPGTPPLYLSIKVVDQGSGVDPESVEVSMDNQKLPGVTYDAEQGLLWYIYDRTGRGGAALSNGEHNFVIRASDWRGNQAAVQLSLTIDNSLPPPSAASTGARPGGGFGPGGGMGGPGGMPGGGMGPGGGPGGRRGRGG